MARPRTQATKARPTARPDNGAPPTGTREEWISRAGPHTVTLRSGMVVRFRVLGLGTLIQLDAVPEHLSDLVALHLLNRDIGGIDAVMAEDLHKAHSELESEREAFRQRTRELAELTKILVVEALVEPKLTIEDLELVPWEDLEELMRLCTGQRGFDSRGVRIGVEPLAIAARFHDLHELPYGEGDGLGPEDCPACQRLRGELSSVHVGPV